MSNGTTEKVSSCCSARLDWRMDNSLNSWPVCSMCGKGSWPDGCKYYYKYFPSDYEKVLEARIADLERRAALLEITT